MQMDVANPAICSRTPQDKNCLRHIMKESKGKLEKVRTKGCKDQVRCITQDLYTTISTPIEDSNSDPQKRKDEDSNSDLEKIKDLATFNKNLVNLIDLNSDHNDLVDPKELEDYIEKSGVKKFLHDKQQVDIEQLKYQDKIQYLSTIKNALNEMISSSLVNFLEKSIEKDPFGMYSDGEFMFNLMKTFTLPNEILYPMTRLKLQRMATFPKMKSPQVIRLPFPSVYEHHYVDDTGVAHFKDFYEIQGSDNSCHLFGPCFLTLNRVGKQFETATIYDIYNSYQIMVMKDDGLSQEFSNIGDEIELIDFLKGKHIYFSKDISAYVISPYPF